MSRRAYNPGSFEHDWWGPAARTLLEQCIYELAEETHSYLRHHLALSGCDDTLFSDDATALIHQTSRGYPRTVNNLAVQSPVAAFIGDKTIVDDSSVRAVRRRSHRGMTITAPP